MTNQFNIKTAQKKVLQVTEETVVQLSNLDLGNILREKFNLPDAEVLWDTQGGFLVCKLHSVKKTEEQQGVLQGVPSAQVEVDPDDPSTWKVGDVWVCTAKNYGSIHPYGFETSITKLQKIMCIVQTLQETAVQNLMNSNVLTNSCVDPRNKQNLL